MDPLSSLASARGPGLVSGLQLPSYLELEGLYGYTTSISQVASVFFLLVFFFLVFFDILLVYWPRKQGTNPSATRCHNPSTTNTPATLLDFVDPQTRQTATISGFTQGIKEAQQIGSYQYAGKAISIRRHPYPNCQVGPQKSTLRNKNVLF